ncbi:MAG: pilus assembly protein PilP [Deltaproteobacteria bacterium]|nr:pilus assembly protein PilP [Candidatus Anaeroferrophillus wilburensis]MBN2888100.1 pilus assembly protein PilP [Deltaproteobacteria bacterium]
MVAKPQQLSLRSAGRILLSCALLAVLVAPGWSAEEPVKEKAATIQELQSPTFVYDSLGKRDPFRPFINFSQIERPIPTKEPSTPLEKYSLNQFKLVGILLSGNHYAMVEDPEHISYTISEGDHLGNLSGIIEEIKENEVIIAEPYLDIYDQQQIRKVTLKLHVEEIKGGALQ